ncbi:MAG: hypothetical protein KTR18_02690 [Acidiferrobacterales bacterium]|nr:hypothetical protein [Acidiferrobacterales bacterium]
MAQREGNLEAPTRHPLNWKDPEFYNSESLFEELERVYDLCHGCRRCNSLCAAFPTLFDLVDESSTFEVDGVAKNDYWKVVDHCYLCDLCYSTKCPYTPPHEWNIDFPHLMLRAKAMRFQEGKVKTSEKILANTDTVGKLSTIPVVVNAVNSANKVKSLRKLLDKALGVHPDAKVPAYDPKPLRKRDIGQSANVVAAPAGATKGKVAIFATCFGNYNEPDLAEDMVKVLRHNDIEVTLVDQEQCCGMPKFELGDLEAVARAKEANIPALAKMVDQGWDIMAPVPSCVLMFRQELPLMFPDDVQVQKVADAIYDPFEYLMLRHKEALLKTEFSKPLGKVAYHVACHQRVQMIGQKTKQCLELIPDTEVQAIERCSGHDGTYGVKTRSYDAAMKIAKPVVNKVKQIEADHYGSDCPMAGRFIEHGLSDGSSTSHPISLMRKAYAI